MLLKQLEVAKAAAQRSESQMRDEIRKEAAKLNSAEASVATDMAMEMNYPAISGNIGQKL